MPAPGFQTLAGRLIAGARKGLRQETRHSSDARLDVHLDQMFTHSGGGFRSERDPEIGWKRRNPADLRHVFPLFGGQVRRHGPQRPVRGLRVGGGFGT